MHENGDLYVVNGTYCHRLSPDLQVVAEHRLDADNAHNGHVVLSDGNLVTKDISDNPAKPSVFTVLDPDLAVVDRFVFPWNSVGRFSSDRRDGIDHLYVTSSTAFLFVLRVPFHICTSRFCPGWSSHVTTHHLVIGHRLDTAAQGPPLRTPSVGRRARVFADRFNRQLCSRARVPER